MTKLKVLDLSGNPLVNVNDLAGMTELRTINLSDTDLSVTQIRYLKACLPAETEIVDEGITGEVELELQATDVKYFNAKFKASQSNMSKLVSWGYVLNTDKVFLNDGLVALSAEKSPMDFQIKNLSPDTGYSIWLCATDKTGALHLSDVLEFTTAEIVYDYKGDLVLETQDDVDGCVHVTVSGNLLIGGEGSDITDLSKLSLTSVGGSVTITGCPLLINFGKIATDDFAFKGYLELDGVSASLVSQWNGNVAELRVRNISTGRVNLSKFASLTKLTLQDNNCEFTGFQYLDKVTDAVLSDNQFATVADIVQMTSLKNLDLRNNPLVNVNELADMNKLVTLDLSGSRLSKTQVNYLRACLPSSVDIQSNNLKSSASIVVRDISVKYYNATMSVEYDGISSAAEAGYVLNTTGDFKRDGWVKVNNIIGGASSFVINNLSDNKEYHVWFYIKDSVGSIHLSEADTFKTKEVIETYEGDLVLSTQEEVDDCVHTSVTGDLTIGGTGASDISDLSALTIKSVSGSLTIRNCADLSSFGSLKALSVPSVTLDKINPSITSSWQGRTDELTIKNITTTSACNISAFDEVKKLTLTSNKCFFSGWSSMKNLVDADLRGGIITTTEGFEGMTALKTLNLKGCKLNNINSLAQMPSLTSVDLSNTPLSETQVRYVRAFLPSATVVTATGLTGIASLSLANRSAEYFSASLSVSYSNVSAMQSGYYRNTENVFPGEDGRVASDLSSGVINLKGLDGSTTYYMWAYVIDENGSVHLSEPADFTTKYVNYNYVGNLEFTTQAEIDECFYKTIQGNLTIGSQDSDIKDLSSLNIQSVSGALTIQGCSGLSSFGSLSKVSVSCLILDAVNPVVFSTWKGNADELCIKNIASSYNYSTYSLSPFDEVKKISMHSNGCKFIGYDALTNVISADMSGNNLSNITDIEKMTSLSELDLSDNPLVNVNTLAKMSWLTHVDLSGTPLSETQIMYVKESLPPSSTVISKDITGESELAVSVAGYKYFSASFDVRISGISGVGANGYYINTSSNFPGDAGKVDTDVTSGSFDVSGLESGRKYYVWVYATDNVGSIHLSKPVTFTTEGIEDYTFTLQPGWPCFTDDESISNRFSSVYADVHVMQEERLIDNSVNMKPSDSEYTMTVPEGKLLAGFMAFEGTPGADSYDAYSWSFNDKVQSPQWTLNLDAKDGSKTDVAVGVLRCDFEQDTAKDVDFIRPVAKLNITVDFTGSVGNMSNIAEVSIGMTNHYTKYTFGENPSNGVNCFSGSANLEFTKTITAIPADGKVKVVDERYVFPHQSNYNPGLSISVTYKNGTTKTVKPTYSTVISANNSYDLVFNVVITDSNGSFTVDEIEDVEDNIEF